MRPITPRQAITLLIDTHGYTQTSIAEAVGVSQVTISKIYRGQQIDYKQSTALNVLEVYRLTLAEIAKQQ